MPNDVTELLAREARSLSHAKPTGRWTLPELEQAVRKVGFKRTLRVHQEPMRSLLEGGHVSQFKARNRTEYSAPVHRVSLADILAIAEEQVAPGTGRVGARAKDATRRLESITASNLTNIRAMCGTIAKFLGPGQHPDHVLTQVGREHFIWDDKNQEWSSFLRLVRRAVKAADIRKDTGYRYVGAARTLLDLAATHGWIARTPKHQDGYEPVPAAWADIYNDWRERMAGEGLDRLRGSLMMLFEACARLDGHPLHADWLTVIEHMEDWFRGAKVSARERTSVRRTYRALRDDGLISGPEWDGHARQRESGISLLPQSEIKWVARRYGTGPDGTGEGLKAAIKSQHLPWKGWEAYEDGLVSGFYGLRRALLFFTAGAVDARMLDLPSRGTFPRVRIRGTTKRSEKAWRVATVEVNLFQVLHVAGWMERERGVDWSKSDLRTLLDLDLVEEYLREAYASDDFITRRAAQDRVQVLARLASPYAEKVALDKGDEELADRMQRVSTKLSSPVAVDGEPSWMTTLKQDLAEEDAEATQRRKALRIEEVWTNQQTAADYAYRQLRRVRDFTLEALRNDYGPLAEQVAAIARGNTDSFDREWARRIRDALYWQDQLVVPLRAATSRRLNLGDRKHTADFSRIFAQVSAKKMKSPGNGDFRPNYTRGGDGYCRDLYRLYVMSGGAREVLVTASGQVRNVEAFYVHDLQRASSERLTSAAFRNIVRRVVRQAEDALEGVTFAELDEAHVVGTHFFRHAFATFMARNGRLEVAALYLHHANLDMLRRIYSATSAADYDVAGFLEKDLRELGT